MQGAVQYLKLQVLAKARECTSTELASTLLDEILMAEPVVSSTPRKPSSLPGTDVHAYPSKQQHVKRFPIYKYIIIYMHMYPFVKCL